MDIKLAFVLLFFINQVALYSMQYIIDKYYAGRIKIGAYVIMLNFAIFTAAIWSYLK